MKSLYTKILTLLLVSVLIASLLIGGAGVVSAGKVVKEDSMQILNLTCLEKAQEINEKLRAIEQSVQILYHYADNQFTQDEALWTDQEYMDSYTNQIYDVLESAAKSTEHAVAVYIRFNPEIFAPTAGILAEQKYGEEGTFQKLSPTDLSLYESDDISHVGWYYVPVENGGPTWMEPYENKNLGINMISYIIPMYRGDKVIGIVGMDVDVRLLQECVSAVSVYDSGYGVLMNKDGSLLYHKEHPTGIGEAEYDEEHLKMTEIMNQNQRQGQVITYKWRGESKQMIYHHLLNGMSLAISVPSSELNITRNVLFWQCAGLFVLVMLLAVLISIRVIRQMIKPLQNLTKVAEQVAKGDWDVEIQCDSKDEIGVLAKTLKDTIGELNQIHKDLENVANTDTLTGLYNRHYMKKYFRNYVDGDRMNVGVIFCDLNGLKFANDHYGHAGGDGLLLAFADHIREIFSDDICFRMGGDEFVVIVLQKTEEQFMAQVEKLNVVNREKEIPLSAIGFCYKYAVENLGPLLTEAEDAMYRDKEKFYEEFPMYQR